MINLLSVIRREPCRPGTVQLTLIALALAYCMLFLPVSVLTGTGAYWRSPIGIQGDAFDMNSVAIGYRYFLAADWHLPLFTVTSLGFPEGVNLALTDFVPIVALTGKLLSSPFGDHILPYGPWIVVAALGNGLAMASLARALGASTTASCVAAAFGLLAPVFLQRFGHLGLLAHFLVIFSLALYFKQTSRPKFSFGIQALFFCWCLLSLCIQFYIFFMCVAIYAATLLQAIIDRRLSILNGTLQFGSLTAVSILTLLAFGAIGPGNVPAPAAGFGVYSMNLVSPFWPQTSGVFSWTNIYALTRGSIGGTTGQYEGYNYLGVGVLFIATVGAFRCRRHVCWAALRRHAALVAALTVLTSLALSNHVYLGPFELISVNLPKWLESMLGHVRSSGRFFWPVTYLITAGAVVVIYRSFPSRIAHVICLSALALQYIDTEPWRQQILAVTSSPTPYSELPALVASIEGHQAVIVYPSFQCRGMASPEAKFVMSAQIVASWSATPINSLYAARATRKCESETPPERPEKGILYIFPSGKGASAGQTSEWQGLCTALDGGRTCTSRP